MPEGRKKIVPTRIRKPTICAIACGRNTVAICSARPKSTPASSAPTGLPSPPSTTTMKAMIVYSAPEKALNAGNTRAISTPVTPASAGRQREGEGRQAHDVDAHDLDRLGIHDGRAQRLAGQGLNRNRARAIEITTVMASATSRAVET